MILMVTYDLHAPGRDYDAIEKLLKSARSWAHPQGSVWLLDTDREPTWWRERLKARGDANDEYLIIRLQRHWAAFKLDSAVADWMNSPSRSW